MSGVVLTGRTSSKPADPRRNVNKLSQAGRWKEAVALADRGGGASEALLSEAVHGVAHRLMQVRRLVQLPCFHDYRHLSHAQAIFS